MAMICFMSRQTRAVLALTSRQFRQNRSEEHRRERNSSVRLALAEEVLAEQIDFGARFNFDIAFDLGAAGESHRIFVPDIGQRRNGIGRWRGNHRLELEPLAERQLVGVLHAFSNQHPTSAAHAKSVTVQKALVERTADAIDEADVGEYAGLECFGTEIGTIGNLDLLLFLDELHNGHGYLAQMDGSIC